MKKFKYKHYEVYLSYQEKLLIIYNNGESIINLEGDNFDVLISRCPERIDVIEFAIANY